jgi:hypothetical protein
MMFLLSALAYPSTSPPLSKIDLLIEQGRLQSAYEKVYREDRRRPLRWVTL